jgi:hypothetical protein
VVERVVLCDKYPKLFDLCFEKLVIVANIFLWVVVVEEESVSMEIRISG